MRRVFNFSAGPAVLPESVLLRVQEELLNYEGLGISVLEMSHRSEAFEQIINDAEKLLRSIYQIPENYKVLFLQGGATGMFTALPLNLAKSGTADYVISGHFAGNAFKEGKKYLKDARIAATTENEGFSRVPKQDELKLNPNADYVHICDNNTIFGTRFNYIPDTGNVPLVSDMSSNILSMPIDVSKYGVIYAGAQKNVAPAGLTIVIIREDLLRDVVDITPNIWDFKKQADKKSMLNTPATFPIYICKLVLEWIEEIGGLAEIRKRNEEKAKILYDCLDASEVYKAAVEKEDRSIMNVCFRTNSKEMDAKFVEEALKHDLIGLKGHRLVGGMRASIYNAMPIEGVKKLAKFMKEFEKENR